MLWQVYIDNMFEFVQALMESGTWVHTLIAETNFCVL